MKASAWAATVGVCLLLALGCGGEGADSSPVAAGSPFDVAAGGSGTGSGLGNSGASNGSLGSAAGNTGSGVTGSASGNTGNGVTGGGSDPGAAGVGGTGAGGGASAGDGTNTIAGAGGGAPNGGSLETGGNSGELFSFFVTSLEIMQELSRSPDGFGGDLGGLAGADDICQQAAAAVGSGDKEWRAFLSATDGGDGQPVHAIDRIGQGPWYDRNGRLVAADIAGLLNDRPDGDAQTVNDLPNEFGLGLMSMGDTHDVMTGTNAQGQLDSTDPASTCNDWTSTTASPGGGGGGRGGGGGGGGGLRLGHSWPARSGSSWIAVHASSSCAAGVNLQQTGGGDGSSVGSGGGWGGIYCFALTP